LWVFSGEVGGTVTANSNRVAVLLKATTTLPLTVGSVYFPDRSAPTCGLMPGANAQFWGF
jgi:hypothetical protein